MISANHSSFKFNFKQFFFSLDLMGGFLVLILFLFACLFVLIIRGGVEFWFWVFLFGFFLGGFFFLVGFGFFCWVFL